MLTNIKLFKQAPLGSARGTVSSFQLPWEQADGCIDEPRNDKFFCFNTDQMRGRNQWLRSYIQHPISILAVQRSGASVRRVGRN